MVLELEWFGDYKEKWGNRIVPGAVAHPAKIAYGLSEKIFDFLTDQGWLIGSFNIPMFPELLEYLEWQSNQNLAMSAGNHAMESIADSTENFLSVNATRTQESIVASVGSDARESTASSTSSNQSALPSPTTEYQDSAAPFAESDARGSTAWRIDNYQSEKSPRLPESALSVEQSLLMSEGIQRLTAAHDVGMEETGHRPMPVALSVENPYPTMVNERERENIALTSAIEQHSLEINIRRGSQAEDGRKATQEYRGLLSGSGAAESENSITESSGRNLVGNSEMKSEDASLVEQQKNYKFTTEFPIDTVTRTTGLTLQCYALPVTPKLMSILIEQCPQFSRPGRKQWLRRQSEIRLYAQRPIGPSSVLTLKGETVVDCFGGQAGTGLAPLTRGINYVAIELERRFFEMAAEEYDCPGFEPDFWWRFQKRPAHIQKLRDERHLCPECEAALKPKTKYKKGTRQVSERRIPHRPAHVYRGNLPMWQKRYGGVLPNWGQWVMIRGDSRYLRQCLAGTFDGSVISTPYGTRTVHGQSGIDPAKFAEQGKTGERSQVFTMDAYGTTNCNLDRMPTGAVISTPYGTGTVHDRRSLDISKFAEPDRMGPNSQATTMDAYGQTPGNLDRLPIGEAPAAAVVSTPYGVSTGHPSIGSVNNDDWGHTGKDIVARRGLDASYGKTDGQLGDMLAGAVMSPSYGDSSVADPHVQLRDASGISQNEGDGATYGKTAGQTATMPEGEAPSAAVLSSPFADSLPTDGRKSADLKIAKDQAEKRGRVYTDASYRGLTYGDGEEGQLGGMTLGEVDAAAFSSPYFAERIEGGGDEGSSGLRMEDGSYVRGSDGWEARKALGSRYGASEAQLGNMTGSGDENTFWGATRMILAELFAVLKDGGVLASVTGDYIRDGKRVYFGRQWCTAAEQAGFVLVAHAKAWKVKQHPGTVDLFGDEVEGKKVQHLGMFRKLANANNVARNPDDPDAAIESEDVWFLQKPMEVAQ